MELAIFFLGAVVGFGLRMGITAYKARTDKTIQRGGGSGEE